jgi:hypothetical protein
MRLQPVAGWSRSDPEIGDGAVKIPSTARVGTIGTYASNPLMLINTSAV